MHSLALPAASYRMVSIKHCLFTVIFGTQAESLVAIVTNHNFCVNESASLRFSSIQSTIYLELFQFLPNNKICILFIYPVVDRTWAVVSLFLLGKLGITSAFSTSYVHTAEMMPTVIRSIAVGSASTVARMGALIAPFVPLLVRASYSSRDDIDFSHFAFLDDFTHIFHLVYSIVCFSFLFDSNLCVPELN